MHIPACLRQLATLFAGLLPLLSAGAATPPDAADPVAITVDARAGRHPISPLIYGVAFASSNQLADLNFTLNRSGGNSETRYNWALNAHNLANDWFFESYPEADATPGGAADRHIAASKGAGAEPLITIPMIGWSPKLGPQRAILPSYSVAKYGAQTASDRWRHDAGNGVSAATGRDLTNNDPLDANFPTGPDFQQDFVRHLLARWGDAAHGGVRYYVMDNEYSLWSSTHRDVHPIGPTLQEIWAKLLATATMVKANDPNALILAPEEWSWPGYFYSGYDQQWAREHKDYNPAHYPDRQANGGADAVPWLLRQFAQAAATNHVRLLDYCAVHCYPQEGHVNSAAADPATARLRNASTRQFWDPHYVDPSWIKKNIMLIPRLKQWVKDCYPGTKTGITEYNWGAEKTMNGATAQADILGIFGRENLDLATRWTTPSNNTPTYLALKIFRNYDGDKSTFGDISIAASAPNPDLVSAFGAMRTADGALTLLVINKDLANRHAIRVALANFTGTGVARRWQVTGAEGITHLPDANCTGSQLVDETPAQSITLYVLPAGL